MGGAGVAGCSGPQTMVWNPAATASLRGFAASAGYCVWFLGAHQQSAFVVRQLRQLRVGFGVSGFSAGEFEWRGDLPSKEPVGTFEPEDLTAFLNTAVPVSDLAAFGVSGRFYYSRLLSYSASGFGTDLGVRLEPVAGFLLGASVTDFGTTLTYEREKAWLPTRGRLGLTWSRRVFGQRLELSADGSYCFNTATFRLQTGVEWEIAEVICLRGGCDVSTGGVRPTLGLGLRRGRVGLDYSLERLGYDLGVAHRVSLSVGG